MKRTIGLALILLVTVPFALFVFMHAEIWGILTTLGLAVAVVGVGVVFTGGIALVTTKEDVPWLTGRAFSALIFRGRNLEVRRPAAQERER